MENSVPTICFTIYIGGDLDQAKQVCREYCYKVGFCVTIESVNYIYTGGEESGVRIGIINYARFPSNETKLLDHARTLADLLLDKLCQKSYSIVGPKETIWVSLERFDLKGTYNEEKS